MKPRFTALVVSVLISLTPLSATVHASGGGDYGVELTAVTASATADGTSSVTLKAFMVVYKCNETYIDYYGKEQHRVKYIDKDCDQHGGIYQRVPEAKDIPDSDCAGSFWYTPVKVSGSGNTAPAGICPGTDGYKTFTITSTVAETKTVTITSSQNPSGASVTVNFTNPVQAAPAATATPAKPAATAAPKTEVPAPEQPTISTVTIDGKAVQDTEKIVLPQDKPLVISGKTVPMGVVAIYVYSEPKKYTVIADGTGAWSYTITDLPPGDHHVETEVTDPATQKTSAKTKVLAFTVAEKVASEQNPTATTASPAQKIDKKPNTALFAAVPVVLVVAGSAGFFTLRYLRRRKLAPSGATASIVTAQIPGAHEPPDTTGSPQGLQRDEAGRTKN